LTGAILAHHESFQKFGIEIPVAEIFIVHELKMKGNSGFDSFDHILRKRTVHGVDRLAPCTATAMIFAIMES